MKTKTTTKTATKTKTAKTIGGAAKTIEMAWAARARKIAASRAANEKAGTTVRQQRAAAKLAREKAVKKGGKVTLRATVDKRSATAPAKTKTAPKSSAKTKSAKTITTAQRGDLVAGLVKLARKRKGSTPPDLPSSIDTVPLDAPTLPLDPFTLDAK